MRGSRIEIEALILGYAMSRLNRLYLAARGLRTWGQAFDEASTSLGLPAASFKNLRDEFDPFFENERRGWWKRDVRQDRQRVLLEFEPVSDMALLALVDRLLVGDHEAIAPAVDVIAEPSTRTSNVAERLLTGRRAEDYFVERYESILEAPGSTLEDFRISAQGYDFGIRERPGLAIEIKGIRGSSGEVLFTDREWSVAGVRREDYWLVVVGDLETSPRHRILTDPTARLDARCRVQTSVSATWQAHCRLD